MSSSEWMVVIWGLAVGFCILRVFGPKVLLVVLVTPVALGTAVLGFVMVKDDLKAMVWPAEAPRTLGYDDDHVERCGPVRHHGPFHGRCFMSVSSIEIVQFGFGLAPENSL